LAEPLSTFTATADKYGGFIELNWNYPETQVNNWQLFIFKRQGTVVTAQEIADYFAGELTDEELKAAGIFVFRDIPQNLAYTMMKDFTVEIGNTYHYVAVIWDLDHISPIAQVNTVTPDNVEIGDIFTVILNSISISFTATEATVANVTAGLTALINSNVSVNTVLTAVDDTTHITITSSIAGTAFTCTTATTDGGGTDDQTLTSAIQTANGEESGEPSTSVTADAKPDPQILITVVDGKALVARAIEKVIDAIKTATGSKPIVGKNIKVFKSFAYPKGDDFFVVVSRGAGQISQRTLSLIYAEVGADVIKGEADMDTISVEWLTYLSDRRDQFTNLMRVMRPLMYRYIMAMGNLDVMDIRFVMGGDSQKHEDGSNDLMRGTMTLVLIVKSQIQIGNAKEILPYLIFQPCDPLIDVEPATLSFGDVAVDSSLVKSYGLVARNLTPQADNIIITAPAGYQVSLSESTGFASTLTIPYTNGYLFVTTLYVKFSPVAQVSYVGNLVHSGANATDRNISLEGNGTI
jgi:hypothetical protein